MSDATNAGYQFIVKELEKNPDVSYGDIKEKMEKKGLDAKIYPIMFGRAKLAMGLVTTKAESNGTAKPKSRKVGQPSIGLQRISNSSAVEAVQELSDENRRLRDLLNKIRQLLDSDGV